MFAKLPNKYLAHAVSGRRTDDGLKWDLKDSEGVYNSIDIENMIKFGYDVSVYYGIYWENVKYIFTDYIEELFKLKGQLAKEGKKGTAEYMLSKLFMNGLYGKMIQRPIYEHTAIIKSNSDYWRFWSGNIISSVDLLGESIIQLTGKPRTQEYINENANRASNQNLREIAANVESSTLSLFDKLNEIKVINCENMNL